MAWGTFTTAHIISLICAILINVGIYFLLKNRSEKVQITVLGILSFAGIINFTCNLLIWGSPLEYLPLHLCNINAIILPFVVFTRNKVISNLTLLWSFGALFALILNTEVADTAIFGLEFNLFYFSHLLELGVPLIMFKLGLCKLEPKCIFSTLGITFVTYTAIFFINCAINEYTAANGILNLDGQPLIANYMYSVDPNNPLLELFYSWIPYKYWFMLPAFGIVIPYLGAIYGVNYLIQKRKKK